MGWDGKDQGRCFLVASRNAFRLSSIDVIALAVNPLHFSIGRVAKSHSFPRLSIFVKRETNWSELWHHRESYIKRDSRWSSSSREGRGREGLCERIIQIENRSSNLRNRDLGWPSRTKFFLILINNAHHVRGFGVLRGTVSLSLFTVEKRRFGFTRVHVKLK